MIRFVLLTLLAIQLVPAPAGAAGVKVKTLQIGQKAPDFNLPGVDGKTYTLKHFEKAKVLAVIFTCNHCPTAQAYEGRIKKLAKDYKPKGVAVVAISPNDDRAVRLDELGYSDVGDSLADMKIRAKREKFNFPYLYDGKRQKASRAYGPVATPHVFIFDAERRLRFAGRIDNAEKPARVTSRDTRNAIDALLAGRPVPVERTRTFGCSIKWSEKRPGVARAQAAWAREEVAVSAITAKEVAALVKNDTRKLRLINVWATWCGSCIAELPDLVDVNRMYRRRPFEMITISADVPASKDAVLAILKKHQASCRNHYFASGDKDALADALDKRWQGALPYTLLVAPGGKVLFRHQGVCDMLALRQAIVGYLGRTY